MKFDQAFIDQVRNSVSIVDVVSGYVSLKKKGKDYAALCPVHHEKTPSFLVSESKRIFKCFGCGVGGDAFEFIMLMEKMSFPESVEHLAERYGIPIPRSSRGADVRDQKRQGLLRIMAIASRFFCERLEANKQAMAYLKGRQIDEETVKQFSIGYAPPGQTLWEELRKQGITADDALTCGLIREGKGGQYYDRFRNRVMIPICDLSAKTIAFGGRILGEGLPKYLNSPETPLYSKGSHLFPLNVTRDEIRRRDFSILVEGYFDCIVPYQFGVRNVAASLGTSLTENQVSVLGRYTRNVIINFDPDSAGTAATMRSIDLFLERGFRVNVLQLPGGQDPDSFIQTEGGAAYWERAKASQPFLDFALSQFVNAQKDPSSPRGKQEIVSQVMPYVAKIPKQVERAEYLTRIASRLQIDEQLLAAELGRFSHRKGGTQVSLPSSLDRITPAERTLVAALIDEEWGNVVGEQLKLDMVEGLKTERIFRTAFELKEDRKEVSATQLRQSLTEREDRELIEALAVQSGELPFSDELIRNSVQALRRKQYERLSLQLQEEIKKEEQEDSGSDRIEQLLMKKEQIRRQITESDSWLTSGESARE